ncbi:MAG: aminoglycoside phosphotransferase family protein [Bacillus subtilis]|nr:aminoglycoside phosphotransferase family protein [Bacillus subtilis]
MIKIAPSDPARMLAYEAGMMREEVRFYETMRTRAQLRVPAVYAVDFSHETIPADYFIMERLAGETLDRAELSAEERSAAERRTAEMVAAIHAVRGVGFGYPQNGLHPDWFSALTAMVENLIGDARRQGKGSPNGRRLLASIRAHREILEDVESRLVNFDVWAPNIVCTKDDEGLQLARIDPERCFWGDRIADFVCLEFMNMRLERKTAALSAVQPRGRRARRGHPRGADPPCDHARLSRPHHGSREIRPVLDLPLRLVAERRGLQAPVRKLFRAVEGTRRTNTQGGLTDMDRTIKYRMEPFDAQKHDAKRVAALIYDADPEFNAFVSGPREAALKSIRTLMDAPWNVSTPRRGFLASWSMKPSSGSSPATRRVRAGRSNAAPGRAFVRAARTRRLPRGGCRCFSRWGASFPADWPATASTSCISASWRPNAGRAAARPPSKRWRDRLAGPRSRTSP